MKFRHRLLPGRSSVRTSRQHRAKLFRNRRQALSIETLESRRVLAAYISELHYDPLFGDDDTHQYLELRGEPGHTLADGTYFVGVESADGVDELGDVHTVIDLSGLSFGSNGYMVFLQSGSGFPVDPSATVIRGDDGFSGLSAGVFESDGDIGKIHGGSSTFMVVQSAVKPNLFDDIDANDDGAPDGAYLNWQIHDAVAVLPWIESVWDQYTYAPIAFVEDGVGDGHLPDATVVTTDQQAYVGRIAASEGYSEDDWLSGNTVEQNENPWAFQFQHGPSGTPRPEAYAGRILDHVGAPNWFGSLKGEVFEDLNDDGIRQPEERSLSGIDVRAQFDVNPNDEETIWETIEPDDFRDGTNVTNISNHVTLVTAGNDNVPLSFETTVKERNPTVPGDHIFAHVGVGFHNESRRLRMDFYRPVRTVSILIEGDSSNRPTFGRLEIFDKDDNSLGFVRSEPIGVNQIRELRMTSNDDIAWAVAYSENSFQGSSPFGRLDTLRFEIPRADETQQADGSFSFQPFYSDVYEVSVADSGRYVQVSPTESAIYTANLVGAKDIRGLDFGFRERGAPVMTDQQTSAGEHIEAGTVISKLPIALDYPGQELNISITAGDPNGQFAIDSDTLELSSANGDFNFEDLDSYTLEFLVEDRRFSDLFDTGTVTVTIQDENDEPVVEPDDAQIDENIAAGSLVAIIRAEDEDESSAGEFQFSIADGNVGGAFEINPDTGELRVAEEKEINFEKNSRFDLMVRATDMGTPEQFGEAMIQVDLNDLDEIPEIDGTPLMVDENSPAGALVGELELTEYDAGETITWRVSGIDSRFFVLRNNELYVAEGTELDFETKPSYSVFVEATDSANPPKTGTRTIAINLNDVNDAPVIVTSSLSVDENSPAATMVGAVEATDQDAGQTLTYAITGGEDAANFVIDENSGFITTGDSVVLDFETDPFLLIEVTATDSHDPAAQTPRTLVINLNDVNDAPAINVTDVQLEENTPVGTAIAVPVDDADAGDTHRFEILQQQRAWFTVDAETGQIVVAEGAEIDFEGSERTNLLQIRVTDAAGASAEAEVTFSATDVNDAPEVAQPIADQDAEPNQMFEFTLPTETFVDQDFGDSLRYSATTEAGFSLPDWIDFDASTLTFSGTPADSDAGDLVVRVTAIDDAGANVSDLFVIGVAEPIPWQNSESALDVSNDSFVTPIDALMVINFLNTSASTEVPSDAPPEFGFVDVNGDNFVTPIDALIVINQLNNGDGEGEFSVDQRQLAFSAWGSDSNEDEDEAELIELLALDTGFDADE
ncbi:MAG: cadherin domain-containing protein [Planctomycetota bacterium]